MDLIPGWGTYGRQLLCLSLSLSFLSHFLGRGFKKRSNVSTNYYNRKSMLGAHKVQRRILRIERLFGLARSRDAGGEVVVVIVFY